MPPAYNIGVANSYDPMSVGLIPEDVWGVAQAWFPNRHPLTLRFRHAPVGSDSFKFANELFRPRSVKLTADATNSATTITVADASIIEADDVIKIENEYLLVSATSGASPGTLTVERGYAGTTAAAHTAGTAPNQLDVFLITNARTGYAEDVPAMTRTHSAFTQWCQTAQTSYAVGGSLQADSNYMGGAMTPLAREKMAAIQRVLDQFESGLYRGRKVARGDADDRPAMAGLEQMIVSNKTTTPTNASAYKPSDMIRDTVSKIFAAGGEPTHLLVSPDWLSAFYAWGVPSVRTTPDETVLGTKVRRFAVPFMDEVEGIVAPLLPYGTLVALSEPEVTIRMKREMFDKPRGSRGDVDRGDIIMEGALELDNEAHHAWVSGVSGFAKEA